MTVEQNIINSLELKIKGEKYKIEQLKRQLESYRKLQSEVHKDIEKVWMYDSSYGLDDNETIDRDSCIERVFYKIANQWIE